MAPTIPPAAPPSGSDSGPIVISSDDDSGPNPIVLSSGGSASGPIVLSSSDEDEDEPARKKSRRENWPFCDQVRILTALAAHRQAGEELPSERALFDELKHQLSRERFTARDLYKKVANLRDRYVDELYRPPVARRRPQDKTLMDLSTKVWPELQPPQVELLLHVAT
ncbi:hypothetical protein E2562_003120 [Oryza meyeriana var. granulata]|uniref:Glabrous enhancer-binding protein-like DBD domain-containing protein n=1 Tax=Oryza meyeriana var. granulata TaxID=110450 RepID=A0A6G1E986_9ORYZ|nr:hypothetical protein E2562_003120 [Oryza meyeriana var. granulata]